MDYSSANTALWNVILQLGMIAGSILLANFLRNRLALIRNSMMPIAVMAGFLLLLAKYFGLIHIDGALMEMLVYHGIALGFIAMSLRVPDSPSARKSDLTGLKSGAVIVSTYMIQGVCGLLITLLLSYTFLPGLFKASGLLLPMGYGQGPGQANNIGSTYEALGFVGGRSFGLSIAAAGYLVACVVGVIMLNIMARHKGAVKKEERQDGVDISFFQDKNEIPVSDSIDKLSVQLAMVLLTYLATYLAAYALTSGIAAISAGLAKTLNTLIWGFNFIIGAALAMLLRVLLEAGKKRGLMKRQYQNNYLLNRISGFFFDLMIAAGIASINLEDLSGLWLPFLLLAVIGGVVTWYHLKAVCREVYPEYYEEGLISMFGMMTGTISSGVLLLRELDPDLTTPAANNLVIGSSFGIVLGIPVLILVGIAPRSPLMCWLTVLIAALYYLALRLFIRKAHRRKEK